MSLETHDKGIEGVARELAAVSNRLYEIETSLAFRPTGLFGLHLSGEPKNRLEAMEADIRSVSDTIKGTSDGIMKSVNDMGLLLSKRMDHLDENHQQLAARMHSVFRDKQHYDLLRKLQGSIVEGANALDKLSAPDPEKPSPEEWAKLFEAWQYDVQQFSRIATEYNLIQQSLVHTTPDEYKASSWTVTASDVGSEDALHEFKKFRLLKRNFEDQAERVLSFVGGKAWV